jgi:hypothetical protein
VEVVNGAAVDTADASHSIDAVVSTAYKVVEENVQAGRLAAERLHGAGHAAPEASPNARALAGRLMHMTRELGGAWVDLILAVMKEPEVRGLIDRMTPHDRWRPDPSAPPRSAATSVTQRVASRRPVEVTLSALPELQPGVAPAVAGLHALDPAVRPLGGVAFARRADGGLDLAITIADDQPAETYWGTLVDTHSRQPIGTLTIRVLE